jgi:hypothetical protein
MDIDMIPWVEVSWCQRRDLNPRPKAYESSALPLSYSGSQAQIISRTWVPMSNRIHGQPQYKECSGGFLPTWHQVNTPMALGMAGEYRRVYANHKPCISIEGIHASSILSLG